ncbi:M13 family metallopeptidase [Mycetocola zhadangensis]|uniref:Peptidase M13 n=1 Tax=Mycetocola zhadangensis TaxID=1164595 RepID=A0A3L7J0T1_9MICO|nr:M13-type metalloendopeptidase [Mycetocola zhadangensis]RLQ83969.1 peptidase M13 [Mycetocola zhadangensis]GGE97281.1 putative zinc metalloprotease [Mycetocola zhadangensis]
MTNAPLDSGIALDELDKGVRPQDDLYRHVNGKWLDRTEIPADKARWGSFHQLAEEAEKAVKDIISEAQDATGEPSGDTALEQRKVGDLYSSFMDDELIDTLGVAPIAEQLASIDAIESIEQLVSTVAGLERAGVGGFFQLYVDNDPGNPERYLVQIEQGGISLPDESYYREDSFAAIREAYLAHVQRLFELAADGIPAGEEATAADVRAQRVFELETSIAAAHWDNVRTRDSEATYNLYSWADASALFAGTAAVGSDPREVSGAAAGLLETWRVGLGAPEGAFDEVVVREPSFFEDLAPLLVPSRLEAWKDWLAWKVIHGAAPYLSSDFVEENFDFYGRTLSGTPELRERWKRGVSLVEGVMGEAVGKIYVERHFPPQAKEQMDVLVDYLVEAYRQSISTLDWMSEATRARALEKLEKFTPKIGFPVKWRDYATLTVDKRDLLGNVRRASAFEFDRELGKIGKPLDRDEWFMTPQTINAYYNPGFNEIVFPAAILQFPFFDEKRDAAANYGAIGAVIGHEIGHGFDDQGSKYDGDGRLTDWWTEEDRAAFEQRTASLIEQYNTLAPAQVPDNHVNGALTIGENIGDLGGLSIAWKAYLLSLGGEEPPVIDGLTGAERFFLSWAQAWQQKSRDAEAIRLLAIDPHSPNEFRCNQIVRNIDEFYDTFGVTATDALWLDEAERVTIW